MAVKKNLRVFVFAYKDIEFDSNEKLNEFIRKSSVNDKEITENIILLGIIGLVNPIRPEAKSVIE